MTSLTVNNNSERVLFLTILGVLGLIRYFLIYLNPVAPLDCPWSLSNAFNTLDGGWMFNSYFQCNNNRFYGYLFIPFFALIKGKYSIFILFEIVKILFMILIYKMLKGKCSIYVIYVVCLLFFLDKEINIYREELVLSVFVLLFFYIRKNQRYSFYLATLFFIILFLLHPISAIVFSILYITFEENIIELFTGQIIIKLLVISISLGFLFFYIWATPFGDALSKLGNARMSLFNFDSLFYFVKHSLPFVVFFALYNFIVGLNWKTGVATALLILIFSITGGHYYFIYFYPLFILEVSRYPSINMNSWMIRVVGTFILLTSFCLSVVHPIYTYIENPNFVSTINRIFKVLEEEQISNKEITFISNHFAMPLIDRKNVRMSFQGLPYRQDQGDCKLKRGDIIYLISKEELNNFRNSEYSKQVELMQIVNPTRGVLSLTFLYNKRVNEYGLWKCTVLKE